MARRTHLRNWALVAGAALITGAVILTISPPDPERTDIASSTTTNTTTETTNTTTETVTTTSTQVSTTTTMASSTQVATTTTIVAGTPTTTITSAEPAPAATTSNTVPTDTEPITTTTVFALPDAPPAFNTVTPTQRWPDEWPDEPTPDQKRALQEALDVWGKIESFWTWYLQHGHSQAHNFDARSRPELSEQVADQLNWVHHNFWQKTLPEWDRVWNEAWTSEREQQRDWLMITSYQLVYNPPDDGTHIRYWGPTGCVPLKDEPDQCEPHLLPLVDLDETKAWMAERGHDLDLAIEQGFLSGGFGLVPGGFSALNLALQLSWDMFVPLGGPSTEGATPISPPGLDPELEIWKAWAASVDLEAALGPQAAGGKMGPADGEIWYQWHPEGFDMSPLYGSWDISAIPDDWWPERLVVPIHDPAQSDVGGTIAPGDPETGNHYFEICLWASGGLFGPWSLPHPNLPEASANTTWWFTGTADTSGTILEISQPQNRPCLSRLRRRTVEENWQRKWEDQLVGGRYDVLGPQTLSGTPDYQQAYIELLERHGLGSWMWRQHPDGDPSLGWEPSPDSGQAPQTLGVMIHPRYGWDPHGDPAGYPAAAPQYPWKWWPISPSRDHPADDLEDWWVALGGCAQTGTPYQWVASRRYTYSGFTTDGGPIWAWPGTVFGGFRFGRATEEAFQAKTGNPPSIPYTPRTFEGNTHPGMYYPPVPCTELNSAAYQPEWIAMQLGPESPRRWMPAVGEGPPPG